MGDRHIEAFTVAGQHPSERLLGAQDVQRGSLRGDGPPTPLQVAAVLHGLADHTHIQHMLHIADRALLVSPAEELPWPSATSLGRYFHGMADYIETGHEPRPTPRARMEALCRLLVDEGHLTPMGKRQFLRTFDEVFGRE